ncbi:MAG: sensor histidine kinase [Bradymonadaceae bacterium]
MYPQSKASLATQVLAVFLVFAIILGGMAIIAYLSFAGIGQQTELLVANAEQVALIEEAKTRLRFLLGGGLILALLMSVAIFRIVRCLQREQLHLEKEVTERVRAEEALREFTESLELTVKERTAVLLEARSRLERELEEKTRLEDELEQSLDELRIANRELEEFAYVASHDLQEPLRKIQAFGDRLESKCGDALTDQGRDYLARMQNAAGRMSNLINDLLNLSRITTQAKPFEPVDLDKIIEDVLSDMEVRLEEEEARVEIGDLPVIEADPIQMAQLFQNLISNAVKFRRDEPPVIKIFAQRDDEDPAYFQIFVEDNGIGFDQKYADRIFTVFQRLHGRKTFEGSGIGLAICRKIVGRHGGEIDVESEEGKGTTFIVTLPEEQIERGSDQENNKGAEPTLDTLQESPPPGIRLLTSDF